MTESQTDGKKETGDRRQDAELVNRVTVRRVGMMRAAVHGLGGAANVCKARKQ